MALPPGLTISEGKYRIKFKSRMTEPGKIYSERLPAGTAQRDAERILRERRMEDHLGQLQWPNERRSEPRLRRDWAFGEFAEQIYLPHISSSLKPSTLQRYKQELTRIAPWFWDLPLANITARDVAHFAAERKGEDVRSRTVNIGIQQVRHVLQVAHELDYLPHPPPRFAKLRETDKRPIAWLSHEQADHVLLTAQLAGDPWPAFVLFMLHTGARFSEARQLRWENVDLHSRMVHFVDTKSGKARIVPLLPEVCAALRALPKHGDHVFMAENWSRKAGETGRQVVQIPDYAHSGRRRYPWSPTGLRVNPHTFRHTFATWRLQQGVSIAIVSALLGHASIQITVDVYGHIQPQQHEEEVARSHRPQLRVVNGGSG